MHAEGPFVGIEGGTRPAAWRLSRGTEIGLTCPNAHGRLIEEFTLLAKSSMALHAEPAIGEGRTARFSVAQPLPRGGAPSAVFDPGELLLRRSGDRLEADDRAVVDLIPGVADGSATQDRLADWCKRHIRRKSRIQSSRSYRSPRAVPFRTSKQSVSCAPHQPDEEDRSRGKQGCREHAANGLGISGISQEQMRT